MEDFGGLQGTLGDFRGLQGTSEDFRGLQGTSEDFRDGVHTREGVQKNMLFWDKFAVVEACGSIPQGTVGHRAAVWMAHGAGAGGVH